MKISKATLWTIFAIMACAMWGISSLFAKYIFQLAPTTNALWLTQIRQLISGSILITISGLVGGHPLKIWHNKQHAISLIAYGLFGMLPVQYCYFVAVQLGNASIATVLQFLGPFFIIFYLALFRHQRPLRIEIIASIAAFIGVFLLATHGHLNHLAITPAVLFWGLLSAIGVATNTLIPQKMIKEGFSSLTLTGWAILIAGIALTIIHPIQPSVPSNPSLWWSVAAVVVIGTLIPFQLATNSLKYIKATTFSLMDAFEPITATIGSVLFFNVMMKPIDWFGSILIVVATLALSIPLPAFFKKTI